MIAAVDWRGATIPSSALLARYAMRIAPIAGPGWRVRAIREVSGRPLLRARLIGGAPAVTWQSVGGLVIATPSHPTAEGAVAELPVNNQSAYRPSDGPGPWRASVDGQSDTVFGWGLAHDLPDQPPADRDNRYQTVEVTWMWTDSPAGPVPASPAPPTRTDLPLLGFELPNRPTITSDEWARFDALGSTIAKARSYHALGADATTTVRELARRGARLAIRPDSDGDLSADWQATGRRLVASARAALTAGVPGPIFVILDSEPNLHGAPVPDGYADRLERARRLVVGELGDRARVVSPPFAVAQGEERWHETLRSVIGACDYVGAHAYGQSDLGLVTRFLQFGHGKPFLVAELGDSTGGLGGEARAAQVARYAGVLAARPEVAAICVFILGGTPEWQDFVLPTAHVRPIRAAVEAARRPAATGMDVPAPAPPPSSPEGTLSAIPPAILALIRQVAAETGMDAAVLTAMVWKESGFDPDAVGDQGQSVGLLQLHAQGLGHGMPEAARRDPLTNLRVGARAHVAYLREFGSVEAAIAAHNAGGPAVRAAYQRGEDWRTVPHHRRADGSVATVREVYVEPIVAQAAHYRAAGVGAAPPPSPIRVQLDAIWGEAEALRAQGWTGTATRLQQAVAAIKDHWGLV